MTAPVPAGFDLGSLFGAGIAALILHLHITQAISFERPARPMHGVFGRTLSGGAIANPPARARTPLPAAVEPIAAAVRASAVVGSGFLRGARPGMWVADRYGGQLGHGAVRQMCLAHLLRDATYAADAGDTVFAPGLRRLPCRAMAIGKRRARLKDTTLAHYRAALDRRLDRLLPGPVPKPNAARRLFNAMRRDRDDLLRFITRRDVPSTNNAGGRALRPSVIFRKVTNCVRAMSGAEVYAAAASVIATGRLNRLTALEALRNALAGVPIIPSPRPAPCRDRTARPMW